MTDHARSVVRTFQVFDAIAREQRPLSSAALAASIGAPRSSMADLLRTLVDLNLLAVDRRSATYFPTARFASLGTWLVQSWLGGEGLREALVELAGQSGETVTLTVPADLEIEIVFVLGAPSGIAWCPEVGQRYSVFGTAVGTTYLGTLPASTLRAMHRRATVRQTPRLPPLAKCLAAAREAQRRGFSWAIGTYHPEVAALAAHLPDDSLERPLIVSVGGPTRRMEGKRAVLERLLREFVASRAAQLRAARRR
jgi:IclR family transcriptional regulator, acetate operon repressor